MMLIYGAVVVALITGSLYALVTAHEERKAAVRDRERRAELRRVMQITHDLGKRGPTGWSGRGGHAA